MTAEGSTTNTPDTPMKGGVALVNRLASVKKCGLRWQRGVSSTLTDAVGGIFEFLLATFLTYRSIQSPGYNRTATMTMRRFQNIHCYLLYLKR